MKNRKFPRHFWLLLLFLCLLTGSSLAFFSDYAVQSWMGSVGNLELSIEDMVTGKRVFPYDTFQPFHIHARNMRNKSMDVKIIVTVESNLPITDGISFGTEHLPCFRLFSAENPTYSYAFDPEGTPAFTETADSSLLTGSPVKQEEETSHTSLTFTFQDLLNGNHPAKDNEKETEGKDRMDLPFCFFLPSYPELPYWEPFTRNAYYKVTVTVLGKQHRNTSESDWNLLFQS